MTNVYVTRKKYESLKDDLEDLIRQKQSMATEIAEAAGQGDLRENAAYIYAKERQSKILRRMGEIQIKLNNAKLLDTLKIDKSHIRIGATVTLQEHGSKSRVKYTIVGSEESDPADFAISVDTPLARAMLGLKEGESFTVVLPKGAKTFNICKVSYR
jgi:transcription elongation factor GreA